MPIFFLSVLFIHKKLALNISFQFSGHMILNANLMLLLFKAEKIIQMNDVHSDETFFPDFFLLKLNISCLLFLGCILLCVTLVFLFLRLPLSLHVPHPDVSSHAALDFSVLIR